MTTTTIRIYNNFCEIYDYIIPTANRDAAITIAKRKFRRDIYGDEKIIKIEVVE